MTHVDKILMEKTLILGGLELRLTDDKLYIKTGTGQESFALRSITGIGVQDLIQEHSEKLKKFKEKESQNDPQAIKISFYIIAGIFFILGIFGMTLSAAIGITLLLIALFWVWLGNSVKPSKRNPPKMQSAVNIMMSGGLRSFKFNKQSDRMEEVAEFVALIENTLTSY